MKLEEAIAVFDGYNFESTLFREALSIVLEAARKQLHTDTSTVTLSDENKQGIARALSAGFDLKTVYELGKFNEEFSSFAKFKKAWALKEE